VIHSLSPCCRQPFGASIGLMPKKPPRTHHPVETEEEFLERCRRQRLADGLPEFIEDETAIRKIAQIVVAGKCQQTEKEKRHAELDHSQTEGQEPPPR
jgi:hypothetical protein